MSPRPAEKESASEISRRFGLEDLSKARSYARRFYINTLASKAFSLVYDYLPMDEDMDYWLARYPRHAPFHRRPYFLRDAPIVPRRSLPSLATRMLYDKRLAENAAARREALMRREDILSRYYLDDPLALLDLPDDDLDPEVEEEYATDKTDKDKEPAAASTSTKERTGDHPPALPEGRHTRRCRYPRLTPEAFYGLLEAGI